MATTFLYFFLNTAVEIIKNWWWLVLPFVLWKPFLFLYKWWRIDGWLRKQKAVVFEISLPKESLKPIRAMETVLASIHGATYQPPDWWEMWIDGQVQISTSFEIVSKGGEIHFYIKTGAAYADAVESAIYSQYPEAEVTQVDDYTKYIPQSIPNKEWGLWATDYKLVKDDHYPIKTYPKFETERETKQEKVVDPISSLLEALAKVKPGEEFWLQIITEPIAEKLAAKWVTSGEELRDKLSKRPGKSKDRSMFQEGVGFMFTGKVPEEQPKEKDVIPPEMRLTPGEKDILTAMEQKMAKPIFKSTIRFLWLGRKEVWLKPNFRLGFSFFNSFSTLNLNSLYPLGKTITKVHKHWFLPVNSLIPRRLYLRGRKLFRNYVKRFSPFFPRQGGTFMLNVEEVASLFHFPSKIVAPNPNITRIGSKKGGTPIDLPTE